MKYIMILVLSLQADGHELTNMVTMDNFNSEQECRTALRSYVRRLDLGVTVEYGECQRDLSKELEG